MKRGNYAILMSFIKAIYKGDSNEEGIQIKKECNTDYHSNPSVKRCYMAGYYGTEGKGYIWAGWTDGRCG